MAGLRIGVNALYLIPGGVGGTEIYLRSLLAALARLDAANEYVVFTNRETPPDLAPAAPNFRLEAQPVAASNRPARILWEQFRLPGVLRRHRIGVLLNPGFTTPWRAGCPSVSVFHDLQHKRHPEHFRRIDLPFWRLLLWQAARTSRALIAVSQATAADLDRYYPGTAAKTRVIHHGVDERFFEAGRRRGAEAREPEILCVSTLHPHKNLERLVRAFDRFRERRREYRLVLAGMRGFHTRVLEELVGRLGLPGAVRITGWLPRDELYGLFAGARSFVYPSTFEGFGMPVLEALACGIPAACSRIPALVEIASGAVRFFDPESDEELLAALEEVTLDGALRERLAAGGPAHAAAFTWSRAAVATLAVLREAAGSV